MTITRRFYSIVPARIIAAVVFSVALIFCGQTAVAQNDYCTADTYNSPIFWNLENLEAVKQGIQDKDVVYMPAFDALMERANEALGTEPYSVTDKERAGPSGDKQDYVSLSRYYWPDPKRRNGLPYIRKDGRSNPELNGVNFDRRRSQKMTDAVRDLSLAAYFSGDQKYAEKAKEFVFTWFIHDELSMNPHMKFGQSVPGKQDGREFGILDSRIYWDVMDSLLLLQSDGMVGADFVDATRNWFGSYAVWLINSDFGKKAMARFNNHGTFYDAQLSHVLIFAGRCDLAEKVLQRGHARVEKQISDSGLMPEETERTKSLFYHTFNAEAFIRMAHLSRKLGADFYSRPISDSGSIKDTVDLVASYAGRVEDWPYEEISEDIDGSIWKMLKLAQLVDNDQSIQDALNRLGITNTKSHLILLTGK